MSEATEKRFIYPIDKQVIEAIITATCVVFEIDRISLMRSNERAVVALRQYCFYLTKTNTEIGPTAIGEYFGLTKPPIMYGIEKVAAHKNIYMPVLYDLRRICETANTFKTKNEQWHIQLSN